MWPTSLHSLAPLFVTVRVYTYTCGSLFDSVSMLIRFLEGTSTSTDANR